VDLFGLHLGTVLVALTGVLMEVPAMLGEAASPGTQRGDLTLLRARRDSTPHPHHHRLFWLWALLHFNNSTIIEL
jgi:hypothetical protein